MNIQYYGDYCFKITTKPGGRATEDVVIWTDPIGKGNGLRSPQGEADIVLLSHGADEAKESLKGEPVLLDMPGEYSAKGIATLGFPSFQDEKEGAVRGQNTIFLFESEEINICYLGALGHDLSPEMLDKLSGVDILFIPVGDKGSYSAKTAAELARKMEPNVVIPMHYKMPGLTLDLETEKAFCDAIGNCPASAVSKLNIKKKDIEEKTLEVILFERGN